VDIAITGSSGLIGQALTAALHAEGHRVLRMVRRPPGGSDEMRWDPTEGTIDAAGLEGIDAVVNLAGEGIGNRRWSAAQKARIERSRTEGTGLLARTLSELTRPPGVLLSGSAVGIYGDRGDDVLTEASPPGDTFLAGVCRAWESATAPAEAAGIRVAHLRTGIVLSRDGGALARMLPLFRLGLGGRFGSGRQYWSWISIDDEVGAIRWLLDHDVAGPVNLVAPAACTNRAFTHELAAALHRPAVAAVPAFGPRLLLGRELADELLFTSARVRPAALETAGYPFRHPDLASAFGSVLTA
jgi:uncharacterized protein (TIGR01777 family)